jgi:hypothetical protein
LIDVEECLQAMEAAVADGDAELTTVLGGQRDSVRARLWRGQVLVDWEPDESAGGCLLRPGLIRRLIALHADTAVKDNQLVLHVPGRTVAALSPEHAELVARMGGARRITLNARLQFENDTYRGGEEAYVITGQGRSAPLLRLIADVKPRSAQTASQRTSPAPT